MSADLLAASQLFAAIVTAGATIALWHVTRVLARETKVMAARTSHAHVVAAVEPDEEHAGFLDLVVSNEGNAVAYDIEIKFDPPLPSPDDRPTAQPAMQNLSLLKPGQSMRSFVSDGPSMIDNTYQVTVSWSGRPDAEARESLEYTYDLRNYRHVATLEAEDKLKALTEEIKRMRQDRERSVREIEWRQRRERPFKSWARQFAMMRRR